MIESWLLERNIAKLLKPWLRKLNMAVPDDYRSGLAAAILDGRLKPPEESEEGDFPEFARQVCLLVKEFDEVAAEDLRRSSIRRVFKVITAVEFEVESTSTGEVSGVIAEILERCDFTAPNVRVTCVAIDEIRDPNDEDG